MYPYVLYVYVLDVECACMCGVCACVVKIMLYQNVDTCIGAVILFITFQRKMNQRHY